MLKLSSLGLVEIILISLLMIRATDAGSSEATHDRRGEMIAALPSLSAHKSMIDQAKLFDTLVGTWDTKYSVIESDGKITRFDGEVLFGWILDGRALQDIWISYPKSKTEERKIGTSVRFYNEKTRMWHVVWVDPMDGDIVELAGGPEGNRIVFKGNYFNGGLLRWSFNDIEDNSFVWRSETSADKGKSWKLQQEHHMKRRNKKS